MTRMSRLVLIKHSLPQIVEGKPPSSWTLSPEGKRRASMLAVAVAAIKPVSVHSSAEEKAMQTAEFITDITGLTLSMDPGFNEHDRSQEPFIGSNEEFKARIAESLRKPDELIYGSETISAAVDRFTAALSDAEKYSKPGNMVVVSHGTVISAYVASRVGVDPVELWQSLGLPGLICVNWPEPDHIELRQNFE